jgi:hypothetical protein
MASLCAVTLLSTTRAVAQPVDPQSFGVAQAIFDSAQELMVARQYGAACPKLEEVVRLVPSGVGAKMLLATCYEEAGRLASAWAAYLVAENAASVAGQVPRAKAAGERAAALQRRLSTLAIVVPDALRAVAGLDVKRNGNVVAEAEWGVAVPLDGGTYTVTATAPARTLWKGEAQLSNEGSMATVTLPGELEAAPETPPPAAPADLGDTRRPQAAPSPAAPPPAAPLAPRADVPAWAWAAGGAGLFLWGVSAGFLVDERAAQASIDGACRGGKTCAPGFDARGANARLYRDFDVFVATGVGGVLLLGASIAGIATAPRRSARPSLLLPWATTTAAGLRWGGHFQ